MRIQARSFTWFFVGKHNSRIWVWRVKHNRHLSPLRAYLQGDMAQIALSLSALLLQEANAGVAVGGV